MRTSVAITALDRIPPPKAKTVACTICWWETPRWQRRETPDEPRRSGVLLVIAHQLAVHGGEAA